MNTHKELARKLSDLNEETLTRDIVMPLLNELGYKDVRYVHGMHEHGVDVLCTVDTPFGSEFCGFQIKSVPIHGDKKRNEGNVAEIINQASAALRHHFADLHDNTSKKLDKYIVVTSSHITEVALQQIADSVRDFGRTVRFLDGMILSDLVQNKLGTYIYLYFNDRSFILTLAHDMLSTFFSINSDIELLTEFAKDNSREASTVSRKAIWMLERATRTIRNITAAFTGSSSQYNNPRAIDAGKKIKSIVHRYLDRSINTSIACNVQNAMAGKLFIDVEALTLILDNLFEYAFLDSIGTSIDVVAKDDGKLVSIEITYAGSLIPQDEIPMLFHPFYVSRSNVRRSIAGGLMLSVARNIAKQLSGDISLSFLKPGSTSTQNNISEITIVLSLPSAQSQ